jgi:hypothetical protein
MALWLHQTSVGPDSKDGVEQGRRFTFIDPTTLSMAPKWRRICFAWAFMSNFSIKDGPSGNGRVRNHRSLQES